MLLIARPMLCIACSSHQKSEPGVSISDQILARINRVLAGDFSSSSQNVGMCPARPGFEYDFEKELKAEFAPDQLLGPAKCFQVMNGLFCVDQKRLSKKHLSAAIQAGRAKRRPHRMLSTAPLHASHTTRPLSPTGGSTSTCVPTTRPSSRHMQSSS